MEQTLFFAFIYEANVSIFCQLSIKFCKCLLCLFLNQFLWCHHSFKLSFKSSSRDDFKEWSHDRIWWRNNKVVCTCSCFTGTLHMSWRDKIKLGARGLSVFIYHSSVVFSLISLSSGIIIYVVLYISVFFSVIFVCIEAFLSAIPTPGQWQCFMLGNVWWCFMFGTFVVSSYF